MKSVLRRVACVFVALLLVPVAAVTMKSMTPVSASGTTLIPDAGFETGDFTGWDVGPQTGTFTGATLSAVGTGVQVVSQSALTFQVPNWNAFANSVQDATTAPQPLTLWTFGPSAAHFALLQPNDTQQWADAWPALGLSSTEAASVSALATATTSGMNDLCNGWMCDVAWIKRDVTLSAGTTYSMAWNYIGADYAPFNDGSVATLVPSADVSSATVSVNNGIDRYAMLGFTVLGTGDYSTGSYSSTGWQTVTYTVSMTGVYTLGFAVFNLADKFNDPILLVDDAPGVTLFGGQPFAGVPSNNPNAPSPFAPPTSCPTPSGSLSGIGAANDPYLISSAADLLHLATTSALWTPGHHFLQTADIDMNGCTWSPIGNSTTNFTGTYDGGGFAIANLSLLGSTSKRIGLFGEAAGNVTIENLSLENVALSSTDEWVGGLIGYYDPPSAATLTIRSVSVSGSISGDDQTGGLVGEVDDLQPGSAVVIEDITLNTVTVSANGEAGGLIGMIDLRQGTLTITDVTASAIQVTSTGDIAALVVAHINADAGSTVTITDLNLSGDVTGDSKAGGLLGEAEYDTLTIERVYFTGTVSVENAARNYASTGGLIGFLDGDDLSTSTAVIRDALVVADVIGKHSSNYYGVGGIVGYFTDSSLLIENVTSEGAVESHGAAGGLIGEVSGSSPVTVRSVTRSGPVTASKSASAVSAYHDGGLLVVEDSWFDSDVTGFEEVGGGIAYVVSRVQNLGVTFSAVALLGDVMSAVSNPQVGCYAGEPTDGTTTGLNLVNGTLAYGSVIGSTNPRPCPGNGQTPPARPVRWLPLSMQPSAPPVTSAPVPVLPPLIVVPVPSSSVPSSSVVPSTSVAPPVTSAVPASSVPASSVPVPVPDGGVLPVLAPGASQVLVDGVPEVVEVFVEASTDLVVQGQDFELRLAGECSAGCTIETSSDGRQVLTLEERGLANVSGEGFSPGSPVYVWLFSEPRFLGELVVNADGSFTGQVPLGDIAAGEHTLQVNGTSFDGRPRTANLGVLVNASQTPVPTPGPGVLPATGSDTGVLWWVLVLVLSGVGLVAGTHRRPVARRSN